MLGKVAKYDNLNEIGYILGYDELTYFYHQINVIENKKLKEGDLVSFDYEVEKNQNQLPYAVNIIKEERKKGLKSYKELYEIIIKLPEKEQKKIPNNLIKKIKNDMDKNYEFKLEHIQDFENQDILDETRSLLATIYRDYLASDKEKIEIRKQEMEEYEKEELEKKDKYNLDVFANKKIEKNKENNNMKNSKLIVKEERKWFLKFVDFFKKFFKK